MELYYKIYSVLMQYPGEFFPVERLASVLEMPESIIKTTADKMTIVYPNICLDVSNGKVCYYYKVEK